jgi:hypothetical protein
MPNLLVYRRRPAYTRLIVQNTWSASRKIPLNCAAASRNVIVTCLRSMETAYSLLYHQFVEASSTEKVNV